MLQVLCSIAKALRPEGSIESGEGRLRGLSGGGGEVPVLQSSIEPTTQEVLLGNRKGRIARTGGTGQLSCKYPPCVGRICAMSCCAAASLNGALGRLL